MSLTTEVAGGSLLPPEFAGLEPYVGWCLRTETERIFKRQSTPYEQTVAFRDALLADLDRVFAHLSRYSDENKSTREDRLFWMVLSLAEIAPAVECYHQPSVVDGFAAERFLPVEHCRLRPSV